MEKLVFIQLSFVWLSLFIMLAVLMSRLNHFWSILSAAIDINKKLVSIYNDLIDDLDKLSKKL